MYSVIFYILSLCIILACLFFLWKDKEKVFNLKAVFNIFYLLFFGVIPIFQYSERASFFGGRTLLPLEYVTVTAIFFAIVISFNAIYYYLSKKKKKLKEDLDVKTETSKIEINGYVLGFFLIGALLIKGIFIYSGYVHFFQRGFFFEIQNKLLGALANQVYILISIIPLTVLLYVINGNIFIKNKFLITVLVLVAVTNAFPTAMSRANVATLYLPILILWCRKYFSVKYFSVFLIGCFLIIFPMLNKFREYQFTKKMNFFEGYFQFNQGHYDNYYNFALTYFDVPITYGQQLVGAFLFFVPRALWHNKPIGSGNYMANIEGLTFGNVSQNFFAEGYINFGILGIILFVIIYAWLAYLIDEKGKISWEKKSWKTVIYLQLVFLSFYLMRGDLISSFSLIVNYILANGIIYTVIIFFNNRKRKINNAG